MAKGNLPGVSERMGSGACKWHNLEPKNKIPHDVELINKGRIENHWWVIWSINFSFLLVLSFCELAPTLLERDGVDYLLSEIFSQDPLKAYFSKVVGTIQLSSNFTAAQYHWCSKVKYTEIWSLWMLRKVRAQLPAVILHWRSTQEESFVIAIAIIVHCLLQSVENVITVL